MTDPHTGRLDPNHPAVQRLAQLDREDLHETADTLHDLGHALRDAGNMAGLADGPSHGHPQSLSGGAPQWVSVLVQRLQALGPIAEQILEVIHQYRAAQAQGQAQAAQPQPAAPKPEGQPTA